MQEKHSLYWSAVKAVNRNTYRIGLCPLRHSRKKCIRAYYNLVSAAPGGISDVQLNKKELFNHRRRWLMSSAACSGTSVSALLGFTYDKTHRSFALATSSKHQILSGSALSKGKWDRLPVLGEKHILGEYVHSIYPLLPKPRCH